MYVCMHGKLLAIVLVNATDAFLSLIQPGNYLGTVAWVADEVKEGMKGTMNGDRRTLFVT